jgi:hypothetical protein
MSLAETTASFALSAHGEGKTILGSSLRGFRFSSGHDNRGNGAGRFSGSETDFLELAHRLVIDPRFVLQQGLNCRDHPGCADETVELDGLASCAAVCPWLTSVEADQLASYAAV